MQVSDSMQRQAKALADPSRFQLFRYIAEASRPVTIAELTDLLGFNHNAIRQHMEILAIEGLVAVTTERRTTRGRPRKLYALRSDALSSFASVSGSYEQLAMLLIEINTTGDDPHTVGYRSASQEPGISTGTATEVVDGLRDRLAAGGFEPRLGDQSSIELMNCPFAEAAAMNPDIVCELHRGLLDGHVARWKSNLRADLLPSEPAEAGCVINVRQAPDSQRLEPAATADNPET